MDDTTMHVAAEALRTLLESDVRLEPTGNSSRYRLYIRNGDVVFDAIPYERPVYPKSVGALAEWLREEFGAELARRHVAVILEHASRATAERLREWDVCFIDTEGNAYLRTENFFVLSIGLEKTSKPMRRRQDRAFSRSGLQVVFGFLADPELLDSPYRDIADAVGVSHGTVGLVVESLRELDYLAETSKGRFLTKPNELRSRWAAGYAEVLRPKLLRGHYRFTQPAESSDHIRRLPPALGLWSGEPGADLLTNYLKPGSFTLYSDAKPADLARALRIVRDDEGPLELLQPFWDASWEAIHSGPHPNTVHPLLVWADLLAVGDARSRDVAGLVLEAWEQSASNKSATKAEHDHADAGQSL